MLQFDELRAELIARGFTWQPRETGLAAATREGQGAAFLGVRVDAKVARAQVTIAESAPPAKFDAMPPPPPRIDWRDVKGQNYVTPIRNQGTCGACVSFATCASMEARLAITEKKPQPNLDLSEAHLFFCAGRTCGAGWWPQEAMDKARTQGVGLESDFAYRDSDTACKPINPSVRVIGWDVAEKRKHRKQAIAFNGPVIAVFKVYEDFMYYGSGVYAHVTGEFLGLHAVAVIGYDDQAQAWLIKNSWSEQWGDGGYAQIAYDNCGIDTEYLFWDPMVARDDGTSAKDVVVAYTTAVGPLLE